MAEGAQEQHSEEAVASLAIFIQAVVLAAVLALGHSLARRRVNWIGDAGLALGAGAGLSAVLYLAGVQEEFQPLVSFNKEFFFIVLLPPIIFNAGYCLDTESFFCNIGAISTYAFAGTAINTAVVGLVLWLGGLAGACLQLPFLEALLFGSIVSATDPVTVLAVFEKLHADPNLYSLVFGESVLNDAVAIVLYRVLAVFLHQPVTAGVVLRACGMFLLIFLGSMAIGAGVAFLVSYMVKSKFFRSHHAPVESCLVVLLAFSSYLLADALSLSGIVAVLFCGMVMAHYTKPNLSKAARDRTGAFFKVLSTLAESFVFLYIGASLFISQQAWEHGHVASFVAVSLLALALSRAANIWPLSAAVNYLRSEDSRVPRSHQFMLFWAGLRGAMAFALALQVADDLPGVHGEVMLTAVYFLIFITVHVNGGSCAYLLSRLGLKADEIMPSLSKYQRLELLQDEEEGEEGSIGTAVFVSPELGTPRAEQGSRPPSASPSSRLQRLRSFNNGGVLNKLNRLDERFLGKIFLANERGVEMQEAAPAGDADEEDLSEHQQQAKHASQP